MSNTDKKVPIFMVNGFLESGKTQFIKFTMEQDYFKTDNDTLLLLCEEGEEEYPEDLLESNHTHLISIESEEDIEPEKIDALIEKYQPERIIIEWNGTWQQDTFKLSDKYFVNQYISIFDTSRLDLYIKNMKTLMGPMLKETELVICNRADDIEEEKLSSYYVALKAMASEAEIVFEGKDGEIRGDFSIQLPYDIDADELKIDKDAFGIFYIDSMERPERYDGKEVEFTAQVLKPRGIPSAAFVAGRRAMTCCEADIQFLGFICMYSGSANLKNKDWVKVRAKIKAENSRQYGGKGPIMYVKQAILTGPIEGLVQF